MPANSNPNITPFTGSDQETDPILYFTDNTNEPRKLNIRRAIGGNNNFSGSGPGYTPGSLEMQDFITACPKVPLKEIKFDFEYDPTIPQSNFKSSDGMVFSYQNIYKDGRITAPAIFSAVAYPEEIQYLGSKNIEVAQIPNKCLLYVPKPDTYQVINGQIQSEVAKVRILFRDGDLGAMKIMGEVAVTQTSDLENFDYATTSSPFLGTFTFLNDRTFAILGETDAKKVFDNVPQKAKVNAVANNRMMYANYEEGFDTFGISTEATVIYKDKPNDLFDFGIKAVPSMVVGYSADEGANGRQAVTKNAGFYLDVSGLPDQIAPGDFSIRIIAQPKRNFHAYNAESNLQSNAGPFKSIHGSLEKDESHQPSSGIYDSPTYSFGNASTAGSYASGNNEDLGGQDNPLSTLCTNRGVGLGGTDDTDPGNQPYENFGFSGNWVGQNDSDFDFEFCAGSSAQAPLIIKGDQLVFELDFTTTLTKTKDSVAEYIISRLCGNLFSAQGFVSDNSSLSNDRVAEVNINLGLQDGAKIDQSGPFGDLICIAGQHQGTGATASPLRGNAFGYFIVNRAVARFACERDNGNYTPSGSTTPVHRCKICLTELFVNDIKTAIPFPEDGFSPFVYDDETSSPWVRAHGDFASTCFWPGVKAFRNGGFFNGGGAQSGSPTRYWNPSIVSQASGPVSYLESGAWFPAPISHWRAYSDPSSLSASEWKSDGFDARLPGNIQNYIDNIFSIANNGGQSSTDAGLSGTTQAGWEEYYTSTSGSFPYQCIPGYSDRWMGRVIPLNGITSTYTNLDGTEGDFEYYNGFYSNYQTNTGEITLGSIQEKFNRLSLVDGQSGPGGLSSELSSRALNVDEVTDLYNGSDPENPNPFYAIKSLADQAGPKAKAMNTSGSVFAETLVGRVVNMPFMMGDSSNVHDIGTFGPSVSTPSAANGGHPTDNAALRAETADGISTNMNGTFQLLNLKYRSVPNEDPSSASYVPGSNASGMFSMLPTVSNFSTVNEGGNIGSFKTNALHNFGIVYYDERGRRSGVVPIDPVYVNGYSDKERPSVNQKGGAAVRIKIKSQAPPWATDFRIVYGGNSTIDKFVQYSVDGAFAKKTTDPDDSKFYVSLNYLQKSEISYARAGGARNQLDLTPDIYRFTPGDKLRVISYYDGANEEQLYANSEEVFDIVEVVTLNENMDNHPFADTSITRGSVDTYTYDGSNISSVTRKENQINPSVSNGRHRLNGQFLVLRNNVGSNLFGLSDFGIDSGLGVKTNSAWERRVIVEIFTPKVGTSQDITEYYELGYDGPNDGFSNTYGGVCKDVTSTPFGPSSATNERIHYPNVITIEKGDVFFRQVPVNLSKYENNQFVSLITANTDGEDTSGANFLPVSLESNCVVDYHKSSSRGYGRPAFVIPNESNTRNETSIIHSEPTLSNIFDNNFSSFPLSLNFKDLPIENGAIDYIVPRGSNLTVLQRSKVSDIGLGRDLLSTASGQDQVTVSNKVLGAASFYPINYGSSGSSTSVFVEDDVIYFADLDNQKIVKIDQKGLDIISEKSMDKYFKNKLSEFLSVHPSKRRAVMGYDPVNDELIFTLSDFTDQVGTPNYMNKRALLESSVSSFVSGDSFPDFSQPNTTSGINLPLYSIAYSPGAEGQWTSRYDYAPSCYANVRNEFLSFRCTNAQSETIPMVWRHNMPGFRNSFYGADCASLIQVSVNGVQGGSPSSMKEFNAISLETNKDWDVHMATDSDSALINNLVDYEGVKYSSVPRSTSSKTGNSSVYTALPSISFEKMAAAINNVGADDDITKLDIVFDSPIDGIAIPVGEACLPRYSKGGTLAPLLPGIAPLYVESVSGRTLSLRLVDSASPTSLINYNADDLQNVYGFGNDSQIIIQSDSEIYGDQLRGTYATMTCVTDSKEKVELYAVNAEYTQSKLDPTT